MTYFKNVNTLEELRKQYKELLKQFHPDNPSESTEATQAINTELLRQYRSKDGRKETFETSVKNKGVGSPLAPYHIERRF